jgi:hypothetical protein
MRLGSLALIGAFSLLGCGGEGGEVNTSGGGSCPTCGSTPSIVTSACANERTLASAPTKGSGGSGGTPTTTTTTTTTGGTPFSAPVVNVNTPPSSNVSINCVGGGTETTP